MIIIMDKNLLILYKVLKGFSPNRTFSTRVNKKIKSSQYILAARTDRVEVRTINNMVVLGSSLLFIQHSTFHP